MSSTVQVWGDFFNRYYWDEILDLSGSYPDCRSLIIQFADIERFDMDMAQELLDSPDKVLRDASEALRDFDLPVDVELTKAHIRVAGCPERIRRRDLRKENVGKLVAVNGVVQRITEVTPRLVCGAFKCQRCDQITQLMQKEEKYAEPFECENDLCGRKGPFKLVLGKSEFIDAQKLRIQELTEELKGGEKSQTIDVNLDDDLAGLVLPGNKITITGVLRAYQRTRAQGKSTYFDLVIDAVYIQVNEGQETVVLTQEDKDRMHRLAADPDIVERLVNGFAPTVEGMDEIKEGILCCAVSNGYSLRHDGTPQREYSHMLVCTDPGMAKSNLKHATKRIIPEAVLSSGTGATKAGLTAAAVKDDFANGSWSIEVGVLPLADMGGALIDEFDKMNDADKNKINDALSNCQFEINKAGFNIKLWTRLFLIAFCNPKDGRFDSYSNVVEQVNLTPDTISRFDLIFTMRDEVNQDKDRRVAEKMASSWMGGGDIAPAIPVEDLQKYVAFAKMHRPRFTEAVSELAISQYLYARKKSGDGRVAVTTRYLESLFRLAKAEAQLCLSPVIELKHFNRAVRLLEASIMQVGLDEKGMPDADVIASGQSKSQRDKMRQMRELILEVSNEKKIAPLGEIILAGIDAGFTGEDVEYFLQKLKFVGEICELKKGVFKMV